MFIIEVLKCDQGNIDCAMYREEWNSEYNFPTVHRSASIKDRISETPISERLSIKFCRFYFDADNNRSNFSQNLSLEVGLWKRNQNFDNSCIMSYVNRKSSCVVKVIVIQIVAIPYHLSLLFGIFGDRCSPRKSELDGRRAAGNV